jgi:hypothetical protein
LAPQHEVLQDTPSVPHLVFSIVGFPHLYTKCRITASYDVFIG